MRQVLHVVKAQIQLHIIMEPRGMELKNLTIYLLHVGVLLAMQMEQSGLRLEKETLQLQLQMMVHIGMDLKIQIPFFLKELQLHIMGQGGLQVVIIKMIST
jgi:hypothetical protein